MSKYSLLRVLPVEIFYEIFSYLSAIDIFNVCSNINPHFHSILSTYDRYHVNFQSCLKTHFDLVCSRIQPNQVLSLILSDSDDTPGQFDLFLSRFHIEQFTQLRSLTLIEIDQKSLLQLIKSLNEKPNQLISFSMTNSFDSNTLTSADITRIQVFFYRLKRLILSNAYCLITNTNQLFNLKHLTVQECSTDDLQKILYLTPMLRSLQVTIYRKGGFWIPMDDIPSKLKRLILNTRIEMSMTDIKEFLSKASNLKHFELQTNITDLFTGDDWLSLVEHLITFDFKLRIIKAIIHPNAFINSFKTAFWLEEKGWFVAYDEQKSYVYTVPRFAENVAEYSLHSSFQPPVYTTINFDDPLFYEHINHLTINQCLCRSLTSYRFTNITRLSFTGKIPIDQLQSIVDFSNIYYLKLPELVTINDLEKLFPRLLPRVHYLHLHALPVGHWRQSIVLKQIRILHIQTINSASRLCQQFPNLERLYVEDARSYRQIRWIIHRLKSQLSYISLDWPGNIPKRLSFRLLHDWLKQQQRYQQYRCHVGSFSSIHLWINCGVSEKYD